MVDTALRPSSIGHVRALMPGVRCTERSGSVGGEGRSEQNVTGHKGAIMPGGSAIDTLTLHYCKGQP